MRHHSRQAEQFKSTVVDVGRTMILDARGVCHRFEAGDARRAEERECSRYRYKGIARRRERCLPSVFAALVSRKTQYIFYFSLLPISVYLAAVGLRTLCYHQLDPTPSLCPRCVKLTRASRSSGCKTQRLLSSHPPSTIPRYLQATSARHAGCPTVMDDIYLAPAGHGSAQHTPSSSFLFRERNTLVSGDLEKYATRATATPFWMRRRSPRFSCARQAPAPVTTLARLAATLVPTTFTLAPPRRRHRRLPSRRVAVITVRHYARPAASFKRRKWGFTSTFNSFDEFGWNYATPKCFSRIRRFPEDDASL
ncbi:hypothetical protein C8R45DRAFT_1223868 [Mycena sanguinolenta]|nr:hypothetical protein C8R45DRAFT_1223868 [Mycena sanguinolenta]